MSLLATRIQNLRAKGNLDKNELRPSRYGALDLFITQTDVPGGIITPELKAMAEQSIGSVLETPVINYDGTISIGNTRSVTIADSENTSAMVQITFATLAFGFTQVPTLFHNNEIGAQADFEAKMQKYLNKLAETLDTLALATLSTNKTKILGDALDYTFTGNTVEVPWKSRERIIGDINPMMAANDYYGGLHLVANGGVEALIRQLAQSSIYNAENKTLQYSDKIMHFTPRLTNADGVYGTMYAVEEGSVGLLTRFEREALVNGRTADGHIWGTELLPMINFPVGTYYYESVGDFNAIAGAASADMTRVRKQHFGFSVDVAFMVAYNSNANTKANPIIKAAISSEVVS